MKESRMRAGKAKGLTDEKRKKGRERVEQRVRKNISIQTSESLLIDILDSYHPDRIHSLNKMCHTDVVTGESAGRMVGRSNKEILSVQVSPHSHPRLYWLSSLFHHKAQVYLEGKLEAFSAHHHQQSQSR